MISGVSKVVLPVDEQEAAKEFLDEPSGLLEDPDGTRYALGRWD
jgi:hypothetical protein